MSLLTGPYRAKLFPLIVQTLQRAKELQGAGKGIYGRALNAGNLLWYTSYPIGLTTVKHQISTRIAFISPKPRVCRPAVGVREG